MRLIERRQKPRPNMFVRAAAGAWHVPAGISWLVRRPRLWAVAVPPTLVALVCLFGGAAMGLFSLTHVERFLVPGGHSALAIVAGVVLSLALWTSVLGAGTLLGLGVALFLCAPLLEQLSRRVETEVTGMPPATPGGTRWEILHAFRAALYFLAAMPVAFLLAFVPLCGPLPTFLWGAVLLAFHQTDLPLARRGLDFAARRHWHRRWWAESLGFGLAALVLLGVPLVNVLLVPGLAVAGTLMVLELEEGVRLATSPPAPATEVSPAEG